MRRKSCKIGKYVERILMVAVVTTIFSGVAFASQQAENYAPVQNAIKQAIADGNFSLIDIEGNPEYNVEIVEKNDTYIKLISTTRITFKNPKGAGFGNSKVAKNNPNFNNNRWPKFNIPNAKSGAMVDYDQQIKNSVWAEINKIPDIPKRNQKLKEWDNNGFETGSRTFEFKETYEASYPSSITSVKAAGLQTFSSDILMGFTQPYYWSYTREDNLYIMGIWAAWTKLDVLADAAYGLRLPISASMQMPIPMIKGFSYNIGTYVDGKDWGVEEYNAAGVLPENGNEFVARARFTLSLQANIIYVGYIGPINLINKGVDYGKSFKTPLGQNEQFPLPILKLDPDITGLKISYGDSLANLWMGIGLMIDPTLGSDKVTARWVATGDSIGNGAVEYRSPNTNYNFGPIKADNYDTNTDQANVRLSDYKYYFTVCKLGLSANVQGGLSTIIGSLPIGTQYMPMYTYDCGGLTGNFNLPTHSGTNANSLAGNSLVSNPPSSISVTTPNGGENWVRGSSKAIKWSSTGNPGSNVKIELLRSGSVVKTISSNTSNDGSYSWSISSSQAPGNDYKIRISSTSNPAYQDTSDNNFTIGSPSITVTSPNRGENWRHGTSHTITWSKSGSTGSYVKIELLRSGSVVKTITSSTSNDGSYSWPISSTQTPAADYQIRITSTSNSAYKDTSDNNFIIST